MTDWDKINNFLADQNYSDAYFLALSKNEDLLLIKLMGKTGIILEKLFKNPTGQNIVEYLI